MQIQTSFALIVVDGTSWLLLAGSIPHVLLVGHLPPDAKEKLGKGVQGHGKGDPVPKEAVEQEVSQVSVRAGDLGHLLRCRLHRGRPEAHCPAGGLPSGIVWQRRCHSMPQQSLVIARHRKPSQVISSLLKSSQVIASRSLSAESM